MKKKTRRKSQPKPSSRTSWRRQSLNQRIRPKHRSTANENEREEKKRAVWKATLSKQNPKEVHAAMPWQDH